MTTSTCARVRPELKAFADRELPLLSRLSVARHLKKCAQCREEFSVMQTLSKELNSTEPNVAPLEADVRAAILDQAPTSVPAFDDTLLKRRRRVARKKTVLALGVCSVAGLVFAASLQNQNAGSGQSLSSDSAATTDSTSNQTGAEPSGAKGGAARGGVPNAAPKDAPSVENYYARNTARGNEKTRVLDGANYATADGHVKWLRNNTAQAQEAERAAGRRFARNDEKRGALDQVAPISGAAVSSSSSAFSVNGDASSVVPAKRAVHREGSVSVGVQNAEEASDNATQIIKNAGGFVANTSLETGAGSKRTAMLDCRVPVDQFETVVQKIGQLGRVRAKSLSGQDITAQVAQAGARRVSLQNELSIAQARLSEVENAKKKNQGAIYNSRADVRAMRIQAGQARAQLETLQKYGSLSSLYVSLQDGTGVAAPTSGTTNPLGSTGTAAWNSFVQNARLPLQLLVWALAYSPLWLPLLLVWRKWGRKWLEA